MRSRTGLDAYVRLPFSVVDTFVAKARVSVQVVFDGSV
ncbi:hypothetical protein HNP40_000361 [Mycobacteroides chelonae]|nr:hypothetical protein [Mycobacteroides chelonae]